MVIFILPICELDEPRPRCRSDGFAHERLDVTLTNSFGEHHRLISGEDDFYKAFFIWFAEFVCCLLLPFTHPHVWTLLFLILLHLFGDLGLGHGLEVLVVAIKHLHLDQRLWLRCNGANLHPQLGEPFLLEEFLLGLGTLKE